MEATLVLAQHHVSQALSAATYGIFQTTPAKVGRRIVPIVSPCAGHERHPLPQSGIQGRWARWYFADGRDGGDAAPRRSTYVD